MITADGSLNSADASVSATRIALLSDHPAQQFTDGFRRLGRCANIRLRVYYWNAATDGVFDSGFNRHVRWNVDLHSGYDWWSPEKNLPSWHRWLDVWRKLKSDHPQVILCYGWSSPVSRAGILFAMLARIPILYYGDSNLRNVKSGLRGLIRRIILRAMFHGASGAVAIGAINREFYIAHGMNPDQIHPGVLPADIDSFSSVGRTRRQRVFPDGSDKPLIIGFAGKFIACKSIHDLIEASARLPRKRRWELWLIGDGPLRSRLEVRAESCGIADRVRFLGFKNTDELPSCMGSVDVMVLPSTQEARGLVAVEAMAAGAAMVVSSATGVWGVGDLVEHEATGLVYRAGDVAALTACLRRLMDDPELRTRMADCGHVRSLSFTPQKFADTTSAALVSTVRTGASW